MIDNTYKIVNSYLKIKISISLQNHLTLLFITEDIEDDIIDLSTGYSSIETSLLMILLALFKIYNVFFAVSRCWVI